MEAVAQLTTNCGYGAGLAVCSTLGLVVTASSHFSGVLVFALPASLPCHGASAGSSGSDNSSPQQEGPGLVPVCTLGGAASPPPLQFRFHDGIGSSGFLAFTGPETARLLLVTDAGHDAVHVIDVVAQVHVGYVAAPATVAGPRGVAANGSLVAFSAWKHDRVGGHVVHLYEGSGATWAPLRVLADGFGGPGEAMGQLWMPYGLRFTAGGAGLAVVNWYSGRVSLLSTADGTFVRHIATKLEAPYDAEECEDGNWLVACGFPAQAVEVIGAGDSRLGSLGHGQFERPSALALLPGRALFVRGSLRVCVLVSPDDVAMTRMSASRVGWMVAVTRGVAVRDTAQHGVDAPADANAPRKRPRE